MTASAPPTDHSTPPCFYWRVCRRPAAMEKCGRSVCRECAMTRLAGRGREYPLRAPTRALLYANSRDAAAAMRMLESPSVHVDQESSLVIHRW
jgi:hypothetical protein